MRIALASLIVLLILGSCLYLTISADDLTQEERELVRTLDSYFGELDKFWADMRGLSDKDPEFDYRKAIADGRLADPNAVYIPILLDFEERHRGSDVGLLALLHICRRAGAGGWPDDPTQVGWEEALDRFGPYTGKLFLARVVKRIPASSYRDKVVTCLRDIASSPDAPPLVTAAAKYYLAETLLDRKRVHDILSRRLESFDAGEEPRWPTQSEHTATTLKYYPAEPALSDGVEEGVRLLEQLAADSSSPRLRRVVGVDKNYRIMRFEEDPAQPLVSEMAAALLFRTTRLQPGVEAPPLEVALVDGSTWSLAEQRGKVVLIQFSFTGCGPCEQMYPDLAEIAQRHGDDVSVLTILRDETPEAALAGQKDGKLTWNIVCDGDPGRVTTKLAIDSFPALFIVDRQGAFAKPYWQSDDLKQQVERLLGEADVL